MRVVLEADGGEFQILELFGVEQINDAAAVNGISREAIRMPGDDALGVACFNTLQHRVKNRAPWCLRTERFFVDLNNLNITPAGTQTFHFLALGFNGQDLAVFVLA